MFRARKSQALMLVVAALAVSACGIKRVSRVDPTSVTDLSGKWNDTDSRLVANELIGQSLGAPWVREWSAANGGAAPTIIVGEFRNRTLEHIAVGTFVRDLERAYITSGTVRVVASAEERQEVRGERADQQVNATADTRARVAREQGARFMLQGDVQAIEDSEGREKIVFYQVDATLIDLESNAKVWVGQHKMKKYIQRRRLTP
ncbi:MAG TPA: penicillin-binding protein activator LpoB [Gemmatimonadaceae bacterium]|nr:penicillin-binding protein activator LpoB [Gemmatimonadaceae bacterium]